MKTPSPVSKKLKPLPVGSFLRLEFPRPRGDRSRLEHDKLHRRCDGELLSTKSRCASAKGDRVSLSRRTRRNQSCRIARRERVWSREVPRRAPPEADAAVVPQRVVLVVPVNPLAFVGDHSILIE